MFPDTFPFLCQLLPISAIIEQLQDWKGQTDAIVEGYRPSKNTDTSHITEKKTWVRIMLDYLLPGGNPC